MYVHNIVIWIQKFEYLSKFALLRRYRVIGYCYFMRGSRKSFGGGGEGEGVGVRVIIVFSRGRESEFLLNMNLLYLISSKGFGVGWEGGWGGSGPPAALLIVHVDYLREKLIGFGKYAYQKRRHSQALPT